ncbi:MAG: hypothetical protein A2583_06910 [Bdellovibrionales bacterium RIFOXYD1_FULL_53_11]|nr:MAG: hypothetical protein A2583_06910 [Bdellovibrionales bacterium RIFOXYD1_FULL_53_11]
MNNFIKKQVKTFVTAGIIMLAGSNVFAAEQPLVRLLLSPEQPVAGQAVTAALVLESDFTSPDKVQLFLRAALDGNTINLHQGGKEIWLASLGVFQGAGQHVLSVQIWIEDSDEARDMRKAITKLKTEIAGLQDALAHETDPARRLLLEAEIAARQDQKAGLEAALLDESKLLGTEVFGFAVAPSRKAEKSAPDFVELQSDKTVYAVGARALLTAHVRIQPKNPDFEIALVATLDGAPVNVIRVSDGEAAVVTPVFSAAGNFQWIVDVYFQNKRVAAGINASIAKYQEEYCRLEKELAEETDPVKRQNLIDRMNRDTQLIVALRGRLDSVRRKIETRAFVVTVE